MRIIPLAAFAAITALAAHASRDGVLSDIDFGAASNRVERSGKGAFSGVLPDGLVDNYTGWCAARARTEARAEDGRCFLTFETEPGEQTQFAAAGFSIREPGVYKVTVRARTPGAAVLKCVARLGPPTYEGFLGFVFTSEDWGEKAAYFEVPGGRKGSASFYVHTSPGIVDVERITLERSTPEEFAATMLRPAKMMTAARARESKIWIDASFVSMTIIKVLRVFRNLRSEFAGAEVIFLRNAIYFLSMGESSSSPMTDASARASMTFA